MPPDFPWYATITDSSLEQGDFLFNCPVVTPTNVSAAATLGELEASTSIHDVIILSQSCDLELGKLETVLACPCLPMAAYEQEDDFFRSRNGKEQVRRGNVPGYHMLADCRLNGFNQPILIVSFRQVFALPFEFVQARAQDGQRRLRLLPPYREHLAQAFARFFMRVGLPADIPPFR